MAVAMSILLALLLLFPMPFGMDDGGSVEYRAVLYSVTRYHALNPQQMFGDTKYVGGWRIEILGVEVFDNFGQPLPDAP